jgi:hypothetical protein
LGLVIRLGVDLLYVVAKFPLVGVMWRGYAVTCTGLQTVADRHGYRTS